MVTISLLIVNGLLQNWCLITASGDDETQVKLALLQLGSLLHKKGVESLPYIYKEYQVHLSLHSLTTYACTAKYMYSNICSLYHNLTSVFVFCCIGNRQPWRCCMRVPTRTAPRIAGIPQGDDTFNYFLLIENQVVFIRSFAKAMVFWFVCHYVFNSQYCKPAKEVAFFQ